MARPDCYHRTQSLALPMDRTAEYLDATSRVLDYRGTRELFSRRATYQAWLDIEAVIAQVQAEMGIIPLDAGETIARMCSLDVLDEVRIEAGYAVARHPLMPLINELASKCGDAGRYVHWGVATQNIQQTGTLYLAHRAHGHLLELLRSCLKTLGTLAHKHADDRIAGRTHGQHAVPSTLGFRFALWIDELVQSYERLETIAPCVFIATMGGAVGFYSALGEVGPEMQAKVAARLGMFSTDLPSRSNRTHMCDYAHALALACSSFHKMAEEVALSSSEEFAELFETVPDGVIGSSTMPQKVNPKMSMGIIANCQKIYSASHTLLVSAYRPFEADAAANLIFDGGLPEVVELACAIFVRGESLLATLAADTNRAERNLELSDGRIYSEQLMMKLASSLGKTEAHELMYIAARDARVTGRSIFDVIDDIPLARSVFEGGSRSESDKAPGGGMAAKIARSYADRALAVAAGHKTK